MKILWIEVEREGAEIRNGFECFREAEEVGFATVDEEVLS